MINILFKLIVFIAYTNLNIFLLVKIYNNFTKEEIKEKANKLYILIISSFLGISITLLINFFPLHTIINCLIYAFIFKFKFKLSNLLSAVLIFLILIIDLISEVLVVIFIKLITDVPIPELSENIYTHTSILVAVSIISLILIALITKYKDAINIIKNNLSKKYLKIFIQVLILTILPNIFLLTLNLYNFSKTFILLNVLEILITSYIIFKYIINLTKKDELTISVNALEIHNKNMINMVDGVRTLKHDYNNIFQIINGYISTKNLNELDEYVKSILEECNTLNNFSTLNKDAFDDGGIYGIIGSKHFLALENRIKFEVDSSISYKALNFDIPALCRILGILLDNAIEASSKTENRFIRYEAKFIPRKGATIIRIFNTFDITKKIDLEKIYEKGVSSKKVKSGIGLWEVKKIIKKYKNSQIYAEINKDMFIQNIIIE